MNTYSLSRVSPRFRLKHQFVYLLYSLFYWCALYAATHAAAATNAEPVSNSGCSLRLCMVQVCV